MTPALHWRAARAIAALTLLAAATAHAQPALLDTPTQLAVDAQSNVFVIETGARRVSKFSAAGQLLARFGAPGTGPGQFLSVRDIAVTPGGEVLVLDGSARAILRFSNAGAFIARWEPLPAAATTRVSSLAVDPLGRIWLSVGDSLFVYDANRQWITGYPVLDARPGGDTPGDLSFDSSGGLYLTDRDNARVQKYRTHGPATNPLVWVGWIGGCTSGPLCQPVPGGQPPSRATGWCLDASRCGFPQPVSGTGPELGKGRFGAPVHVAAASNGSLLVADIASGVIQRFDPNGAYIGDLAPRGPDLGQTGAEPVAVAPNGDVYVSQPLMNRIQRFNAAGAPSGVFGGGVSLSVMPGYDLPSALDFTVPGVKSSTVAVSPSGGYGGPVGLAAVNCFGPDGPPARPCSQYGITATLSAGTVTVGPGPAASTLQVSVSPSTPDSPVTAGRPGQPDVKQPYLVVVNSTTPGLQAIAQVVVTVKLQRGLAVVPAEDEITLMPGDPKRDVAVELRSTNVTGTVSLSGAFTSPPPANHLSHEFRPSGSFSIANGTTTRTLGVTALPAARTGNYTMNVTANGPGTRRTTTSVKVNIECQCSTSGDFVPPKVRPVVPSSPGSLTGTSPDGNFIVTAAAANLSATVQVAAQSAPAVGLVPAVSNARAWGFSPDSRYFVVASAGPSPHITELSVYDLRFQNRRVVQHTISGCPLADPTCAPPPSFCLSGPGQPAGNGCMGGHGANTTPSFTVGQAAWGFGPDSRSFVVVDVNPLVSNAQYSLRLFHLAAGAPQAPAIVSTAGPTISSFWRFSPCGDLFMHFHQAFATPGSNDTATFYRVTGSTQAPTEAQAALIVASNGTINQGPVGARVDPAFSSNGDFDVRLLNLAHLGGSPIDGFQSPQCRRR
jgi:hypothetical protein